VRLGLVSEQSADAHRGTLVLRDFNFKELVLFGSLEDSKSWFMSFCLKVVEVEVVLERPSLAEFPAVEG
jgi:hypothetical protein